MLEGCVLRVQAYCNDMHRTERQQCGTLAILVQRNVGVQWIGDGGWAEVCRRQGKASSQLRLCESELV